MRIAPSRTPEPTAPTKVRSPVPGVSDRFSTPAPVPSTVELKLIFPGAPRPVSTAIDAVKTVGETKVTSSKVVVTLPAVEIPPAPVMLTEPSAVISPLPAIATVPVSLKVTTPPAVVVIAALTAKLVPLKVTPAPPLVLTAPFRVVVPLLPASWFRLAAVIACALTLVALLISIMPTRCVPPTVLAKVILPVPAVKVRFSVPGDVPFKILANTIFPGPTPVSMAIELVKIVGETKVTPSLVVVTLPAVEIPPAPVMLTEPSAVISPLPAIATVPVSLKVTTPPAVVVIAALTAKLVPLKVTPAPPLVLTAPFRVVVPLLPASWFRLAAVIACALTLVALLISIMPTRCVPPTVLAKVILPVPAVKLKFSVPAVVPSTTPLSVIFPAPAPVDRVTPVVKVTPVAKAMSVLVVVMSPPMLLSPAPSCVKPPVATMLVVVFN